MQEDEDRGNTIKCLEDIFNLANLKRLVKTILEEGVYDKDRGEVVKCGLSRQLRSHIKAGVKQYNTML